MQKKMPFEKRIPICLTTAPCYRNLSLLSEAEWGDTQPLISACKSSGKTCASWGSPRQTYTFLSLYGKGITILVRQKNQNTKTYELEGSRDSGIAQHPPPQQFQ